MRERLLGEYPASLLTSYLAMLAGIIAQVILVPVYLAALGAEGFGSLMLILGLISYAAIGVGWLTGGLQRILGESFAIKDPARFVGSLHLGKVIILVYATSAALVAIGVFVVLDRSQVPLAAMIAAGLFLVASYELSVERHALTAVGRQSASNLLQFSQVLAYSVTVFVALRAGAGLIGVFACHLGSVLLSRALVPLCWHGMRPRAGRAAASFRPLLARLTGRMGRGYFVTGALIISSQSDILIVGWLGGAQDAARYVLVWKIAEVAVQVLWKIPEMLTPILVRLDATGDRATIKRHYGRIRRLLFALAIAGGVIYAVLGPWITEIWLGAQYAPQDRLGFVLAGAGIVWLGLARLPSILTYALAQTQVWNRLAFIELVCRWTLIVVLYPHYAYLSPLVALNLVHVFGIALAYQWAGQRLIQGRP